MADKYYSFEEAAQKLGMKDDDLINLVSNNALRAYHKGGDTVFKAEDIDNYQPSSQSVPGMESQVIELDDLPDDIEMVDATTDDAPASDDSFSETVGVSGETSLGAQEEEPDSIVIDAEEPAVAAPEENVIMDEDSQNANGELEIEVEEPQDTPPAAPELAIDDSGDLDGETVVTDSSALGITEEINADDVAVNTQEITLQEAAISDEEATMPIEDQGDFTEDLSEAAAPSVSKRARVSARASGYSARAHAAPAHAPAASGNGASVWWTVVIAATVLIMLYPGFLLISIICFDVADTRTTIGVGHQHIPDVLGKKTVARADGQATPEYSWRTSSRHAVLRNVGRPVVPEYYRWIVEKPISDGKKMHEWFGTRKTAPGGRDGVDKFVKIAFKVKANDEAITPAEWIDLVRKETKDGKPIDDFIPMITRDGKEIEVSAEEAEPEAEAAEPAEDAEKADNAEKADGEDKAEEKAEDKADE